MTDTEIIIKLQKTISEYERFCMDFLCMLSEGKSHDVVAYNDNLCPLLSVLSKKVIELLDNNKA
mgnify:CR=1 FL=1